MPHDGAVLVLGAGGFIGRAIVARLARDGRPVVAVQRSTAPVVAGVTPLVTGTLGPASDWTALLEGCGAVVHLASRAHAPAGSDDWIAAEAATAGALAAAAVRAGVARIVLMSSIKVHGDSSGPGRFRASDPLRPGDSYGRAKAAIEAAMRAAGDRLIVVRPPLVYGPEVRANFLALLRLVDRGVPLPFGAIANRRSVVYRDNLVELVLTALTHPQAPGGTFLVRDDDEVSTPGLVRLIAEKLGRAPRLFPCPPVLLSTAARLVGHADAAERLIASLSVDDRATRETLGWRPRVALADGIDATCRWYRTAHGRDGAPRL